MVSLKPNPNGFVQGVVVVTWHKGQNVFPVIELKRIEEIGAAEGLSYNFGFESGVVIVHDIVGPQQHPNIAHVAAVGAAAGLERQLTQGGGD